QQANAETCAALCLRGLHSPVLDRERLALALDEADVGIACPRSFGGIEGAVDQLLQGTRWIQGGRGSAFRRSADQSATLAWGASLDRLGDLRLQVLLGG